jgi:hypothetical protein
MRTVQSNVAFMVIYNHVVQEEALHMRGKKMFRKRSENVVN